jgi:hypothetical protein
MDVKCCVKLGKNASDTCAMLSEAYEGEIMKKSSVSVWHKWFKEDRDDVEGDERGCRPESHRTNENVEKVRNQVFKYQSFGFSAKFRQTVKRPDFGQTNAFFHHDTAPAHKTLSVKQAVSGPKIDYLNGKPILFP